jgi:hypothetical protein
VIIFLLFGLELKQSMVVEMIVVVVVAVVVAKNRINKMSLN